MATKKHFWSKIKPNTPLQGLVLFAVVFAVVGGVFFAFRSFAATSGDLSAAGAPSGKDTYGCPQNYTQKPTVSQGSSGNCVKSAQDLVNRFLYFQYHTPVSQDIAVDGQFGSRTKDAVKQAQYGINGLGHQIAIDGIVGQQTWRWLTCYGGGGSYAC